VLLFGCQIGSYAFAPTGKRRGLVATWQPTTAA
jgi:hypothetical protein